MVALFLSALVVGLSGAMMPGPVLTYTLQKSLSTGPRAGFIIILGHAILEFALVVVIFFGFDLVLKSEAAQIAIGLVGGVLLAYMGVGMIRDSLKNRLTVQAGADSSGSRGMLLSGIALSATNPYFLLWWAIIGLGFIMQSYDSLGYTGVVIYYFGHISADFLWYGTISVVVGVTRKFIKEKPYRIVIAVLGCLLIFFGVKFVWGAVDNLTKLI
jgi:threonine/homoserine/homoserine lactone efflux protein